MIINMKKHKTDDLPEWRAIFPSLFTQITSIVPVYSTPSKLIAAENELMATMVTFFRFLTTQNADDFDCWIKIYGAKGVRGTTQGKVLLNIPMPQIITSSEKPINLEARGFWVTLKSIRPAFLTLKFKTRLDVFFQQNRLMLKRNFSHYDEFNDNKKEVFRFAAIPKFITVERQSGSNKSLFVGGLYHAFVKIKLKNAFSPLKINHFRWDLFSNRYQTYLDSQICDLNKVNCANKFSNRK